MKIYYGIFECYRISQKFLLEDAILLKLLVCVECMYLYIYSMLGTYMI